jgi:hypothetical protein
MVKKVKSSTLGYTEITKAAQQYGVEHEPIPPYQEVKEKAERKKTAGEEEAKNVEGKKEKNKGRRRRRRRRSRRRRQMRRRRR